tara:strand:+ start:14836 stop:15495 length:660 start_codon:yes stop_codon:yes gene_type:complete
MRQFLKKITHPFLKAIAKIYFYKPKKYSYKGMTTFVHPEVFPPHYTLSTKILLDFIDELDLKNNSFLELGCGSGIISLFAASKGAKVTATDINEKALEYLSKSSVTNKLNIDVIHSDLFTNLTSKPFDYIIINPPYYPKNPKNTKEHAWFCGENFEYFKKLFQQLSQRSDKNVLMILSEDCDINHIKNIAHKNNLKLDYIIQKTVMKEKNYIFHLTKMI